MNDVILVNTADEAIGVMEKMEAHRKGVLHRAFSVFIFNEQAKILLHKRALDKYHSGGLWTNACCSHPAPGENLLDAAKARLLFEMGFDTHLQHAFSFIYSTPFDNGLTEHEFDHVFIGKYEGAIKPDANEVCDYTFRSMHEVKHDIKSHPHHYTSWFKIAFPKVEEYLAVHPL